MGMMTIVYKSNSFSATGNALVYRARRIFYIVCVCVVRLVELRRFRYYSNERTFD